MTNPVIDLKGNKLQVGSLEVAGDTVGAEVSAENVDVAAGGDISAGDLQTVLEALDARITVLENA